VFGPAPEAEDGEYLVFTVACGRHIRTIPYVVIKSDNRRSKANEDFAMPRIRAFLRNRRAPSKGLQSPLTRRETDILSLIAESVGNAEIGERLHLGLGTVKGHVADILSKLSASDRAHAAVTAFRRGLIG